MPKDTFVRKQNSCNFRLGELTAPLQKKAMELDRSLNWLVCDMLKSHPYLKDFLEEKSTYSNTEKSFLKEFNKLHSIITSPRNKIFSEEENAFIKGFANKLNKLNEDKK